MLRRYAPEVAKAKQDDAEELEQVLHDEAEREVTISEGSEICGLSQDWLRHLVKTGQIVGRRNGSRYLIRVSNLPHRAPKAASVVDELAARRETS